MEEIFYFILYGLLFFWDAEQIWLENEQMGKQVLSTI